MKHCSSGNIIGSALILGLFLGWSAGARAEAPVTQREAAIIGLGAVAYGLPLVISELTRRVQTNVAAPEPNAHAPINQFGNMLKYPTAANKDIVRMNVDTLYSFAFLDLTKEPMILLRSPIPEVATI